MSNKQPNIKKIILLRAYGAYLLLCVLGLLIIRQLFILQVSDRNRWLAMADTLNVHQTDLPAIRGNIFDCNGNLLSTSIPVYDVSVDATAIGFANKDTFTKYIHPLAEKLADLFYDSTVSTNKTAAYYVQLFSRLRSDSVTYHLIQRKVSYAEMLTLKTFPIFNLGKYKGGLVLDEKAVRYKPFGFLAENTIGSSVDIELPIKSSKKNSLPIYRHVALGIEGSYDKTLKGNNGKCMVQRIAGGVTIPINDENSMEAVNGNDIVTTLDINLQDVASHSLQNVLEKNEAQWGTAILMEVKTGEIKAIANLKRDKNGAYRELYNYAVRELIEPGSTFKLASVLSLIEDGLVTEKDLFDTENGQHEYCPGAVIHESEGHGSGLINLQQAFEHSSNVAISKAIYRYYHRNPDRFVDHLDRLMLSKKLDLQLKGSAKPIIKHSSDKTWSCTSLPWSSIGYEVMLTPLHILMLYNAIANNGRMMKPQFVKGIVKNGNTIKNFSNEVLVDKVCSQSTLTRLRKMMEGVVIRGTGAALRSPYYSAAGKTGTALVANNNAGYHHRGAKVYRSSFCGYFPADNPAYTCLVIVHAPSKGVYYGAAVAGPVFKDLADKVYANSFHLHKELNEMPKLYTGDVPTGALVYGKEYKEVLNKLSVSSHVHNDSVHEYETPWMQAQKQDQSLALYPIIVKRNEMPDVTGMKLRDALFLLENNGLEVKAFGVGVIKNQSVKPGTNIYKGMSVQLQLGRI